MLSSNVSVVITTYKRPIEVLKRALESAVNQSLKPLEILVINDYPEDKKLANQIIELIDSYDFKIRYYDTVKNSGACFARNIGLQNAKGDYISFLDDDDEWLNNKIETQLTGFSRENVGLVYTSYYREDHGTKVIWGNTIANNYTELLLKTNPMALFPMMKTELVKEIGGFDISLPSSQDRDLILRLSLICDFYYIDTPTAIYHVTDESISTNINKKIKGFSLFVNKHKELYKKYPKALNYQMMRMTNNMIVAGEYTYAFCCWKTGVKAKLISIHNLVEPIKGIIKRFIKKSAFH